MGKVDGFRLGRFGALGRVVGGVFGFALAFEGGESG